jgi:uncharacterized SAM-binding protein YcdF (DUF218 family)
MASGDNSDSVVAVLRLLLEAVLVCSGSAACAFVTTWWQIERAGRRVPQNGGYMIVVFGAEAIDGQPSAELQARLRFAASLYRAGLAPLILCSGGHPGAQSEARVMRRALVKMGLPESDIMIDEEGSSTRRTVGAAKAYAHDQAGRALLVSSPYHMHRIGREAQRQGLAAVCWPAATTPVMQHVPALRRQMLREVAATWWYAAPRWPRRSSWSRSETIANEDSAAVLDARRMP